jgi:hypothetical protein
MVSSIIWTYYPWGWSLANLTAIPLSQGVQDYTPDPADKILRPVEMAIFRTDTTPIQSRELDLLDNLSVELSVQGGVDSIQAVQWKSGFGIFRLDKAANIGTGVTLELRGEIQVPPTKITDQNMQIPFPFPDYYYPAFIEGLRWKVYDINDDPRAGTAVYDKPARRVRYTGQAGVFFDMLAYMASIEDLSSGDESQFPSTPMGAGTPYNAGGWLFP